MFQKKEDFDLLQIIEEGVKVASSTAMEEVICNFGIIALSGVPE